ncbi:RagB/SusD family nutrient uptake outer membrane protein [Aestuariibaculum lutulentum]|uniref:RagB/SusD family nutrient uptake outer membrane protein n=1 Tax=Aestuariibaculum lutulentum TaxID=2920935 RepID=A0ABS9RGW6_9FLAO|nr:RagB/SusD family nutrient uptake outer membrane protein [Aestuariibaculum lutulentum]MCH4551337.1 RagB/SusD family nutrient uptake outer membrane protein [Aestuariibaculum lutulentum]
MKNILNKITCIVMIGAFTACSDYLDVTPEDKLLESQLYSTEAGINNQLNGVYHKLTSEPLYGGRLTMSTMEVLGQRYTFPRTDSYYTPFRTYNYSNGSVRGAFEGIWTNAYNAILNLNDLITNIDKYNVLNEETSQLYKGEAYGLRAMIHFDLLRIFGPVYSLNPDNIAIPYYTEAKAENGELLSATEVINLVLADLDMAEEFLANDAIIGSTPPSSNYDYNVRQLRFNYYAVKALQARVNLYAGNTEEAYTAAKFVIDETAATFPWTAPAAIISAGGDPDRVFSKEVIFGPQNVELYRRHDALFSDKLRATSVLYYSEARLTQLFEDNENDYRYNSTWIRPTSGEITFKTFYKFADVAESRMNFRYMQPLIRKSEMYYILAETETDETKALEYLNTVRYNRGLIDVEAGVDIQAEIQKEYMREFYGEGQIFFYYKRLNIEKITNANSNSSRSFVTMTPESYVVPLPESELKYQ